MVLYPAAGTSMTVPRFRYLICLAILAAVAVPSALLHAENAVYYSDASAMPGQSFTIEMTMQNDVVISGAYIPFRWSSPDVELTSVEIVRDRFQGPMDDAVSDIDQVNRTCGVLFLSKISISDQGYVLVGSGVLARLHFTVSPTAFTPQTVYIDSAMIDVGLGQTKQTQYSNFQGTQVIYPNVYAGRVQIFNEFQPTLMQTEPTSFDFSGYKLGQDPPSQLLTIRSNNGAPMSWYAEWTAPWLSMVPSSGDAPSFPSISASLDGLPVGAYRDTIFLYSDDAQNTRFPVPVSLYIVETQIALSVSPAAIDWSTSLDGILRTTQPVSITSDAAIAVDWTAIWDAPWITLVPSSGSAPSPIDVTLDMNGLAVGTYTDSIEFIASDAYNSPVIVPVTVTLDSTASGGSGPPAALAQNQPNPFMLFREPTTRITYNLDAAGAVDITIYNLLGQTVRHLISGRYDRIGESTVMWDGRDDSGQLVPSGHYFYRLTTPTGSVTRRMILIK